MNTVLALSAAVLAAFLSLSGDASPGAGSWHVPPMIKVLR